VVEGYTDVLALQQAGVEEAVAIMGTAITPEQVSMLAGLTDSVVLALDADRAGADAMIRAQKVAGGRGLELRVAAMPEGEDPADMLQAGGIDRFMEIVDGAIDLPSFRVDVALGRGELTSLAGRERVLDEVGPVLKAMGETALGFDELVRKVADRLDTDPSLVLARVRAAADAPAQGSGDGAGNGGTPRPVAASLTPRETRERALLAMCIKDAAVGRRFIDQLTDEHLSTSGQPALHWLGRHLDDPMAGLPRDDAALTSLISELVMRSGSEPASEAAMQLNFDLLEEQRLDDEISAAREKDDYQTVARLLRERADLTERIARRGGWADAA
jgi:DNA primase